MVCIPILKRGLKRIDEDSQISKEKGVGGMFSLPKKDYNINSHNKVQKLRHGCRFLRWKVVSVSCYSETSYKPLLRVVGPFKDGLSLIRNEEKRWPYEQQMDRTRVCARSELKEAR